VGHDLKGKDKRNQSYDCTVGCKPDQLSFFDDSNHPFAGEESTDIGSQESGN
jgi:hypothetical protein